MTPSTKALRRKVTTKIRNLFEVTRTKKNHSCAEETVKYFSRIVHLLVFDDVSSSSKGSLVLIAAAYGLPVLYQSCTLVNAKDLHNFINRLLRHSSRNFQQPLQNERKFGTVIRAVSLVAVIVTSLNLTSVFLRPESPQLLPSLVPKTLRKWFMVPSLPIHGFIWGTQWASMYFYSILFMAHICSLQNSLSRTRAIPGLSPQRFYMETRKLELLQSNYNALMRWTLWGTEVIGISVCVFGFSESILGDGSQAARFFVVAMFSLFILVKIWQGLGAIYETSAQVLAEWQSKAGSSALFRKRLKSMRPIRVEIGGYFYVDGAMTLTILEIISVNTFTVLLAT